MCPKLVSCADFRAILTPFSEKTLEERKICLKIRLFSFLEMIVMGSATTATRKVVLSSTLIGPFKI